MALDLDHLSAFGRALHGPRWQAPLARDLGINVRTMSRWITGENAIPDGTIHDLARLAEERMFALGELLNGTDGLRRRK